MKLLLNIDTALETASVSLAQDGKVVAFAGSSDQKEHAAWLHPAIRDLFQTTGHTLPELDAVAVSLGPGSYTGLRVGLASAKGFCFALNKPLIAIGTLEIMAYAMKEQATELIYPLIDARRDEAYGALYDKMIVEKIPPHVEDLKENSFVSLLDSSSVLFFGSGANKLRSLFKHPRATFAEMGSTVPALAELSYHRFIGKKFADVAYTEPLYIKEFFSGTRKN